LLDGFFPCILAHWTSKLAQKATFDVRPYNYGIIFVVL
jgi:hypothetical protein